jgi:hypothetical protein
MATSLLARPRVTTIEGADPNGESQVVGRFPWRQLELLGSNTPDAHPACGDLRCGEWQVGPPNLTAASGHRAAVVDVRVALPAREPG